MSAAPLVIDAHQHVWDLAAADYPWLGPELHPIDRTVPLEEALPAMRAAGVGATVLVQAADDARDTHTMLAVADAHPQVVGVVGWVPLDDAAGTERMLAAYAGDRRVVGIRTLLHARPDPDWVLRDAVAAGLERVSAAGLSFDYVTGDHAALAHLPALSERHPELRIVVNHLGKPPIGGTEAQRAEWRELLRVAAQNPSLTAKVSGLYSTTGDLAAWTPEQVRPFVEDALAILGPDRLMFGSDWPISLLAGGYERTWASITGLSRGLGAADRAALFGGTAAAFYRLDPALLALAVSVDPHPTPKETV